MNFLQQNPETLNFGYDKWMLPIIKVSEENSSLENLSGESNSNNSESQENGNSLLNDEFLKDDKFNGY